MGKVKKDIPLRGHGFGTAPVFLTSVCAILGAIMFLRFGYAVGMVGLLSALAIVVIGHAITIPTGLAVSEIATNLKVGGGGEYYIISRSFGPRIGATIGVMLYAAQSISIAFYIIGFSEGVKPFIPQIQRALDYIPLSITYDPRMISVPLALILFSFIILRGANIGIKMLWVIFGLLILAIITFLAGKPLDGAPSGLTEHVTDNPGFLIVFAIVFPAFTGMTAGVGLSGDLKDPGKSIPRGIMLATFLGLVIYIAVMIKLYLSAPVEELSSNTLVMYDLAENRMRYLGYIIIVGIFGATLSSAVGFSLIAPRTLQALGKDKIIPVKRITDFIKEGRGKANEPTNGTLISSLIAMVFIFLGDLNAVAQVISMFFLITYGSVCLISFLEHFAGNPSYRPTFRTKWLLSLLGAVLCFYVMFQFNVIYALATVFIMVAIYVSLGFKHKRSRSFAIIFQGVMFQLSRFMKINLQRTMSKPDKFNWRPSIIAMSTDAVGRTGPKEMLRWISHHYGFGTLMHLLIGRLNEDTIKQSKRSERVLIDEMRKTGANYSVATLVSPSVLTAVAQTVQISGISGLDNNTIMFEFHRSRTEGLPSIMEGIKMAMTAGFNTLVLRSTEHNFGYKKSINLWITKDDFKNVNLMILLSYIIMEHRDWADAKIRIYTLFSRGEKAEMAKKVKALISEGRLPISVRSVHPKIFDSESERIETINRFSSEADLTLIGFTKEELDASGAEIFTRYQSINSTLFVCANQDLVIT